jgi:hypothetical protein
MSRSLYFVGGLAAMLLIVLAARVTAVPPAIPDHAARTSAAPSAPGDAVAAAVDDLGAWPGALAP